MRKILATILIAIAAIAAQAQPTDPTYWHYKQKKTNWLFEHDTVRINCLRIDNKLAIDSLGRMWWYNNTAPSLGELLLGNGTYYGELAIGSAGDVLTVSGGTAIWSAPTIGGGAVTGLTENLFLYGAADGSIAQDAAGIYNPATNTMTLGDAPNPGRFVTTDVTNSASISPSAIRISVGSLGSMEMTGGLLTFTDPGGDIFTIGRATWSADMNLLFPSALPVLNQELYAATVSGSDITLGWRTATSGTVTSVATSSPITGGPITSTGTIGIQDAAADAATKGAATFASADFNDNGSGTISIDYANGQAATSGQDGLLQSTDWSTFNKKTGLVQAPTELTGQTTSLGATTVYTTPAADGWYRVCVTATVTTAAPTTMDLGVQLRYTEATDNVAKTFPNSNVNGYNRTTINTTAATVSISAMCHVKASTAIQYITSFSPTGGGSPAYNLHVTIEKLDY